MSRKRALPLLAVVVLIIVVTIAYPWLRGVHRYALDIDRSLHCGTDLRYIGQQLHDYAGLLPEDATIDNAVGKLVQLGHIDSTRLQCNCSGDPFIFREHVGVLHGARERGEKVIIGFDPIGSHHPSVSLSVLYADGRVERLKRNELWDVLSALTAVDEASIPEKARRHVAKWQDLGMWLPRKEQCRFFSQHFSETKSILAESFSHPKSEVRMRGAYVVDKIGVVASSLSPTVVNALMAEKDERVRIYLINAARSVSKGDAAVLEVVRSLFRQPTNEKERLYVATALFMLSDDLTEKALAEELVCEFLRPYEKTNQQRPAADYWDLRWSAVNAVQHMVGATKPIPLLEEMLSESGAKPWVRAHVPRVLKALRSAGMSVESQQAADRRDNDSTKP